ncbi:hypothetical protein DUI87_05753 [Hirundo rustica rustica]|uniref:Lipid droplet-associated serine hydrolase n=1 Tax=Hirundo rustica rustica TaxID=333673 RepID=A0A3M0KWI7_HIRRU|nr:hypothetical protein DUI87_05753 [Hirundo rustica rustica]
MTRKTLRCWNASREGQEGRALEHKSDEEWLKMSGEKEFQGDHRLYNYRKEGCSQVLRSVLLFPTIERMAQSPQGKLMTPLLCKLRYALYMPVYLLSFLPEGVKASLVRFALRGMKTCDESSITTSINLFSVDCIEEKGAMAISGTPQDCIGSESQLSQHLVHGKPRNDEGGGERQYNHKAKFEEEPEKYCVKLFVRIKQYIDVQEFELHIAVTWGVVINQKIQTNKLIFYYGTGDSWCPQHYYDEIKMDFPDGDIRLCEKGLRHAFVLDASKEMAAMITDWLQDDLTKL